MPGTRSRLIRILLIIIIFIIGLVCGAYYHNELKYFWFALAPQFISSPDIQATPQPITTQFEEHSSHIFFDQIEEPLPLVYSDTLEEEQLQEHLKKGAVVLPLGTTFGEPGNVVITAHSSGTTAYGSYRFAFAKLGELQPGQQFQVTTPAATYTYQVYNTETVWPHQVDKLPNDDRSTVTLVTCWPLWTNFKRLLVHAELVSVDYNL